MVTLWCDVQPEERMDIKLDAEAMTAAMAGFLACHVLTLRFLVQEKVIDRDKFLLFLESAVAEMGPGLADQRSLFPLDQLIRSLRHTGDTSLQ
jgi:hypothetical protein